MEPRCEQEQSMGEPGGPRQTPCASTDQRSMIGRSKRYMGMTSLKSDLPQGTLDLLILKTVALGHVHGYAIAQRLQQISRDVVQVPGGSLYPVLAPVRECTRISA